MNTDDIIRIALIPAYKPSETLVGIVKKLHELGFLVITVNDGSGEEYSGIFAEAAQYSKILEHSVNCGKGAALKTGLCHIAGACREPYVAVTLDADGQHSIDDVLRVSDAAAADPDALVIGSRTFRGNVPLRSRLGNGITRAVYAAASGKLLGDTQTGLRAFSHKQTSRMTDIRGDRYEYEMNVLMEYAKSGTEIKEIQIETIYIDGNSSSHFSTVSDSYRIYKEILKFSASSLLCFGIDYLLFCILSAVTGSAVISNIAARIVSASANFEINRRLVFKSGKPVTRSAAGYFMLAVFILICNTAMLTFLTQKVGVGVYIAKIITEAAMFVLSWTVQHTAVFAPGNEGASDSVINGKRNGVFGKMKHRYLWAAGYGAAIVLFTGYVMLDTFILPTVSVADASAINTSMFSETEDAASSVRSEEPSSSETAAKDNTGTERTKPSDKSSSSKRVSRSDTGVSTSASKKKPTSSDSESSSTKTDNTAAAAAAASPEGTVIGTYSDENVTVVLKEFYENDTRIYAADIKLSSAQYLKTAFAKDSYGKNVTAKTSETAAAKNAIIAVNGDYYGARESGYVIRNSVLYRSTGSSDTDVLCIYADGHFEITNSSEKTAEQLVDEGVWQAFSFGPALVRDSEVSVSPKDEVGRAMASNPRTAVGIIDNLHYVFVVADGRTDESSGLTLYQLAQFMQEYGVTTAYNLDGGGSSTMYFDGRVINNPTTSGSSIKERSVSDIVYIG